MGIVAVLSEHLDEGRGRIGPQDSNAQTLQIGRIGAGATAQFEDPGIGTGKPGGYPAEEGVHLRRPRTLLLIIPVQLGANLIGSESHVAGISLHGSILVRRSPSPLRNAGILRRYGLTGKGHSLAIEEIAEDIDGRAKPGLADCWRVECLPDGLILREGVARSDPHLETATA
jgi:hypothetical protein